MSQHVTTDKNMTHAVNQCQWTELNSSVCKSITFPLIYHLHPRTFDLFTISLLGGSFLFNVYFSRLELS